LREALRGCLAAAIEDLGGEASKLERFSADVAAFAGALATSRELGRALGDSSVPLQARRGVLEELLAAKALPGVVMVLMFALEVEVPEELDHAIMEMVGILDALVATPIMEYPPASKLAARDRVSGYGSARLHAVRDASMLDEIEDELFRFARVVADNAGLRQLLTDPGVSASGREMVVTDLLEGKVQPATLQMARFVVRAGRARDVVGTLDWLAERVAMERGRRVARVVAATELDEATRARFQDALRSRMHTSVTLQVERDDALIGGALVTAGDLVIDGTVRRRLAQLSVALHHSLGAGDLPGLQRNGPPDNPDKEG